MSNALYSATSCSDSTLVSFVSNTGLFTGKTYQDGNLNCFTISYSASSSNDITKQFIYGPYDSCSGCTAPLSAGTTLQICVVSNCDSTTTALLDVPHPTWTNEYGKAVVELNMVALGGMNGLNS
jgi:hypothetical protein